MDLKPRTRYNAVLIFLLIILSGFNQISNTLKAQESSENLTELLLSNKAEFISTLTAEMNSDFTKAEAIITWLAVNFDWKATDYQKRSVQQIIERGGGNCNDLAKVAISLMDSAQIEIRKVQEINIHTKSDRRQASAFGLVKEKGNKLSVFGRIHNDHVWIEIYDQNTRQWIPADPSLGLAGLDNWMKGRVGFEERKTLDPGSKDMLLPFAIFARDSDGKLTINRTEYYLIESFDKMYDNKLSKLPQWSEWTKSIRELDDKCLAAFNGEINLHDHEAEIESLLKLYQTINRMAPMPSTLSNTDKIYTLSKVWSEVKRNFVFYDRLNFDWDSSYISNLEKVNHTKNDYEFYLLITEFVSSLKDGHTNFYMPRAINSKLRGIPLRTRMIEDKVIVTKVNNDNLSEMGIKKGMEVVRINDVDVHDYASTYVAPYISASTKQDSMSRVYDYQLFRGIRTEKVKLELRDSNGKTSEILIDRNMRSNGKRTPTMSFEVLENNIGLLKINTFFADDFIPLFDSLFNQVLKADKLIIDLRNNGGGNSTLAYYVLKHLTNEPFLTSKWRTRKYMPAFISWKYDEEWYSEEADTVEIPEGSKFNKPVVLLTSVRTFSAAEDFSVAFKQMNRGEVIGQATGGSTGNPIGFAFKDESFVRICTKEDLFANGDKFIGTGIQPDIYVEPTIWALKNHRDLEVEKAIEIIENK